MPTTFDFTYNLNPESAQSEVMNALGKNRLKPVEPKSYFFTESTVDLQANNSGAYGPENENSTTRFNITTVFPLTDKKAYAVTSGQVLIVPQDANKVNVFIKPLKHVDIGVPIKYFVYRGLKKELFIDTDDNILDYSPTGLTPFMTKVWAHLINFNGWPTPPTVDVPATLFGFNTAEPLTTRIDSKFFNVYADDEVDPTKVYNLPFVEAGQHFGEFADDTGGFEIVLNDGFYHQEKSDTGFEFDMTYGRSARVVLDIATIAGNPDISEKIYRENVQNFLDPAAFYGAHITPKEKGEVKTVDNLGKYSSRQDIYNNIVTKFFNRHKMYLYIQCNRGRSFNFDTLLGSDPMKVGVAGTVSPSTYETYSWPIIIQEVQQTHPNTASAEKGNSLSLQLKFKTVNKNASIYNRHGNCANDTIEGNFLETKALIDEANISIQEYTNIINYKIINAYNLAGSGLTVKSISSFIYINHYEKEIEYFNDFFGPIAIENLTKINNDFTANGANKSTLAKYKIRKRAFDSGSSVSRQVFTRIAAEDNQSNPGQDNSFRLYILKKNEESKGVSEYSEKDYNYASNLTDNESYSLFQYGNSDVRVWKGQILDGVDVIKTLQLINLEGEGNVTDFMHLGLMGDDYNKVIYNSLTETDTNHIPSTTANKYFYLEEIAVLPDSLFRKYRLGVKVETYLGLSYDIIYPSPENEVIVYTVDGYYFFTPGFSEKFYFKDEFAYATINFRPMPTYNGEFGFDWLRIGDNGDISYQNSIVSGYEKNGWGILGETEFEDADEAFQALKKEYVAIKTQEPDEIYYVPHLNIYPETFVTNPLSPSIVTLNAKLTVHQEINSLRMVYNSDYFVVSSLPTTINTLPGPTIDFEISIACKKEFDANQIIKLNATSHDPFGQPVEGVVGLIKINKNSKAANRKDLKILYVCLKTRINPTAAPSTGSFYDNEKTFLNNAMFQSYVDATYEEIEMSLENDLEFQTGGTYIDGAEIKWTEDTIHEYLRDKLLTLHPEYKNYFISYSFDVNSFHHPVRLEVNGHSQEVGKQVVIVYKQRTNNGWGTLAHETLHGLGLLHTHKERDHVTGLATLPVTNPDAKFVYHNADVLHLTTNDLRKATDNFMSYNRAARKSTWNWQWKIISDNIKKYIYP